jgi:hypothetical protein
MKNTGIYLAEAVNLPNFLHVYTKESLKQCAASFFSCLFQKSRKTIWDAQGIITLTKRELERLA